MNEEQIAVEEAALDKSIVESIDSVRAGEELKDTSKKPDIEAPIGGTTTGQGDGEPANGDDKKEEKYEFRLPNQGKFESDEAYQKRVELFDLVRRRKEATTPEAKAALSEQIKDTKNNLRTLGGNESINNTNKPAEKTKSDEDPTIIADRDRLRELGGMTKEDVVTMVAEQTYQKDVQDTLAKFVERTNELKDQDVLDVFFDFVDSNYNWKGKTGRELLTILELARESMFKPSETLQDRVLKGADVQQKVNAMQFPGGTGRDTSGLTPEQKKSVDELKGLGYSEEQAVEMIS